MTEGQWRVGITFNPGSNQTVNAIKIATASLIDLILSQGADPRTTALAATAYEDAAMWAVKSVTKGPRDSDSNNTN